MSSKYLEKMTGRNISPHKRLVMKPVKHQPEATDMLSQLQVIYAAQIAKFSRKAQTEDGLTSRDIADLNKLVSSLAVINKEVRESQEQGLLEKLSVEERISLLRDALETLGIEASIEVEGDNDE